VKKILLLMLTVGALAWWTWSTLWGYAHLEPETTVVQAWGQR